MSEGVDRKTVLDTLWLLRTIFDDERRHTEDPTTEGPSWDRLVATLDDAMDRVRDLDASREQ
jgi:hypothetical protein